MEDHVVLLLFIFYICNKLFFQILHSLYNVLTMSCQMMLLLPSGLLSTSSFTQYFALLGFFYRFLCELLHLINHLHIEEPETFPYYCFVTNVINVKKSRVKRVHLTLGRHTCRSTKKKKYKQSTNDSFCPYI